MGGMVHHTQTSGARNGPQINPVLANGHEGLEFAQLYG
jgi:hypothetical protein